MGRRLLFWAVIALMAFVPMLAAAEDHLVLNTGTRAPYTTSDGQGFLDKIVAEVFARMGMTAEVVVYDASARALLQADKGHDDGAAMRIAGLEKKFPNLIRVPEPLLVNDFIALTTMDGPMIAGWDDLTPHSVGYILGWQVFERHMGNVPHTIAVKSADHLFTMLKLGRADVVLYERWQGLQRGRDLGLKIIAQEPPLAQVDMFIYLHVKHETLVQRVAETLRAMKRDGTYQAIVDQTLTPLLLRPRAAAD